MLFPMRRINTSSIVTSRRHYDCTLIGFFQCLTQCTGVGISSDTHIQHIGSIFHGIVNTFYKGTHIARTIALHYSDRHNQCTGIGSDDTDSIISSSYNTSHMGTMLVIVTHLRGIIDEIIAMFIGRSLLSPNIVLQIRMGDINACINDGNDGTFLINDRLIP